MFLCLCQRKTLINCRLSHNIFRITRFSSTQFANLSLPEHVKEPLPRLPNMEEFEPIWYQHWKERTLFNTSCLSNSSETFSMILPPPNITGNLHLGHALTVTVQDIIARYQRMKGKQVSWIPGYDHAGIATQLILDKILMKEKGISVRDLTPDQFSQITSQWRDDRIKEIRSQLQDLGASLDFSREFYTLSPEMSHVVRKAFILLFDKGLIKRKASLVNWSFFLKSTLSDVEIEWLHINGPTKLSIPGQSKQVEFGILHRFSYPLQDVPQNRNITVATTRIETMVGDVAIAVNPNDPRYSDIIGKKAVHPLTNRTIPIIADNRIDPQFGTGAMKVTPSHSPVDYELGVNHGLPQRSIFDENGSILCSDLKEDFASLNKMNRFDAKEAVINMLSSMNLYHGAINHQTKVPVCSRSGDVIETILKEQWFLQTDVLNQELKSHLESRSVKVVPEGHAAAWIAFWTKSREWCISRQIRWGHQIPAFRVYKQNEATDDWVVANDEHEALGKLKSQGIQGDVRLVQDEDVLDTWFSSALLPFSVFGIKSDQNCLPFYPLSLMETGFDILGFWVHRMMIMGKAITGKYPFDKIFLHGMVCDARGKKMSKSKGNVIDPREVIHGATLQDLLNKSQGYRDRGLLTDKELSQAQDSQRKLFPNGIPACGSDALRWSLIQGDIKDQVITMDIKNIDHNRTLINKMWQTLRFFEIHSHLLDSSKSNDLKVAKLSASLIDAWILSRLSDLVLKSNNALSDFELHHLYTAFDTFWHKDLCSTYLEILKTTLFHGSDEEKRRSMNILTICIETSLKTIHPVIPFVTEELFQRLRYLLKQDSSDSIIMTEYPRNEIFRCYHDPQLEKRMQIIFSVTKKMRSIISQFKPTEELKFVIHAKDSFLKCMESSILCQIPKIGSLTIKEEEPLESFLQFQIQEHGIVIGVNPTPNFIEYNLRKKRERMNQISEKLVTLEEKFSVKKPSKHQISNLDFLKNEATLLQKEIEDLETFVGSFLQKKSS